MMKSILSHVLPHQLRQTLKRRMFVVRDMTTRLVNLKRAGFVPIAAIDGGAYQGDWAAEFWSVFPGVPVWLVEPQPGCQDGLNRLLTLHPGSRVIPSALSAEQGTSAFVLAETNSGLSSGGQDSANVIRVPTERLEDLLIAWAGLQPNLLKLDLQGHELKALQGAESRMSQFEVVILEVSVLRIGDVPIFHEVNKFMEDHGFRLYDLIPQYDRPRDGALWQVDAYFVRHDSPLITSRSWD